MYTGYGNTVIVFGFPPEHKGAVLTKLERFGDVVGRHRGTLYNRSTIFMRLLVGLFVAV